MSNNQEPRQVIFICRNTEICGVVLHEDTDAYTKCPFCGSDTDMKQIVRQVHVTDIKERRKAMGLPNRN